MCVSSILSRLRRPIMLIQAKRTLHKLFTRLWIVFRPGLTAFQYDVPWWAAGPLIGLPTYQGLLEGSELDSSETRVDDVTPSEQEQEALAEVEVRGVVGYLATSEMYERYQLASSQSRRISKEVRN